MIASRTVSAHGKEWHYYVTEGGTQPLLLLAGSLGASEGSALLLSENLPAARLIVPEYAPADTMNECLDAVDRILNEQKLDRIALFGGSFGGLIAQCWARRHPDRVTHLILSGTAAPDPSRVRGHRKAIQALRFVPLFMIRIFMRILLWILLRNAKHSRWNQEYVRLISHITKKDLASRYQVAIDLDTNYTFTTSDLPASVKVLILEGKGDSVAGKAVRAKLRDLYPHAQYHVFHSAGHAAMITHTEEWSRVVRHFL